MELLNSDTGELKVIDRAAGRVYRLQKRVHAWAESQHQVMQGKYVRKVMITLTYGAGRWKADDISVYIRRLRKRLGARLLSYAWVAELQQRGAVHYHVIVICKRGSFIPKPDKSGMWAHGMSKIETARTVYYICKYTGKQHQKQGPFPKGLRMWAVWIAKDAIGELERFSFRLSAVPMWLREKVAQLIVHGQYHLPKRAEGGGWMLAGELVRSPWVPWVAGVGVRLKSEWADFRLAMAHEGAELERRRALALSTYMRQRDGMGGLGACPQ